MVIPDKILWHVSKPSRYIGGEWGQTVKDKARVTTRVAFCYPDVYEIGMSNLAIRILYHTLNLREDTWCERVFAPWPDMEEAMRENHLPLYGLESKDPIRAFDFVAFTMPHDLCYTNILNMMDLAGIPLLQKDRTAEDPLVIGGGCCSYNPEPMADFFDLFCIGEGEELLDELMELYACHKREGFKRKEFLEDCQRKISGIYVPSLYQTAYQEDGTLRSFTPLDPSFPSVIHKRIIKNFDQAPCPEQPIVPHCEITQDHVSLEVSRGCIRGCRFCQAGMVYRPVREKKPETIFTLAQKTTKLGGYHEAGFCSLSISDYSRINELLESMDSWKRKKRIHLGIPSLRADSFTKEFMEKASMTSRQVVTFAPEAGTQRLRDVINKNLEEKDLLNACSTCFSCGSRNVKLYFMLGHPLEGKEDLQGIAELCDKVRSCYRETNRRKTQEERPDRPVMPLRLTAGIANFVPKPFTPFQWEGQDSEEQLKKKQAFLTAELKKRRVRCSFHDISASRLEAVFARGDRRIAPLLLEAHRRGFRFDAWDQFFDAKGWHALFADMHIDADFYAARERKEEELLPWDFIDAGVSREFLLRERHKAYRGEVTDNCRQQCAGCGASKLGGEDTCCKELKK